MGPAGKEQVRRAGSTVLGAEHKFSDWCVTEGNSTSSFVARPVEFLLRVRISRSQGLARCQYVSDLVYLSFQQ